MAATTVTDRAERAFVLIASAILFCYPLTETRFREMVVEIAHRRVMRRVAVARAPAVEA